MFLSTKPYCQTMAEMYVLPLMSLQFSNKHTHKILENGTAIIRQVVTVTAWCNIS